MISACSNCGAGSTERLNSTEQTGLRAAMSDGKIVHDFHAEQHLCHSCSAIFTIYRPQDRLRRYFAEEYDVSDTVQNCQVVINQQRVEKHSVIHSSLLGACEGLPASGSMLEIACGEGDLTRKFARRHPGWSCVGVDPSAQAGLLSEDPNLSFVRDFFSLAAIDGRKFDVVVAHGILNRTPTLKMLREIAASCRDGALVSLEIVTLENSYYAPYVWDHSYTFLEATFEAYLQQLGFQLETKKDCGSTIQFIARYRAAVGDQRPPVIANAAAAQTRALYLEHLARWRGITEKFHSSRRAIGRGVALFGAGLYSAVLLNLVGRDAVDYVVDEFRAGTSFCGFSVLNLQELQAVGDKAAVLLCCRERNVDYLLNKLSACGVSAVALT